MAILGLSEPTPAAAHASMEGIRLLMLSELGGENEKRFPAVARRIRYAQDIQALWYARSDLMAVLATTHGETIAREKLACISGKFKGLLPRALAQRAGPRGR
ncbi:MAG: hypothetical protein EAZ34_00425 [Polaromonas sp.]|nr:MAG: hypothetical protein EAZ34_00425 [Polaromonas sp.]